MYIIYIFRIIVLIFAAMFITTFRQFDIATTWRKPERTTAETLQ